MFEIIPELRTLIEHGVRVFYLLDLKLLRAFRDINYMAKNDENDARLLSVITSEKFKECSPDFLRLKELLVLHCRFRRQTRKIQQWYDVLSLNSSKDYIAECSRKMKGIEEEVRRRVIETLPLYADVIRFIGVEYKTTIFSPGGRRSPE